VTASISNGSLTTTTATTDENGIATFNWTPTATSGTLRASIDGAPGASVAVALTAAPSISAVVNGASFNPGITPGSLATIFGAALSGGVTTSAPIPWPFSLANVQVTVNGFVAQVNYVSDTQINFLVPTDITGSPATVVVESPVSLSAAFPSTVASLAPAIFIINATTSEGAVLIGGTSSTTFNRPARTGDVLEIYTTGLGATVASTTYPGLQETVATPQVTIGGVAADSIVSVLSPQFPGLYQINARVGAGTPSGDQTLAIMVNGLRSNDAKVRIF
jgi:uncharacterized protein (TIGR03437 family)